jgi:hypothetical protein
MFFIFGTAAFPQQPVYKNYAEVDGLFKKGVDCNNEIVKQYKCDTTSLILTKSDADSYLDHVRWLLADSTVMKDSLVFKPLHYFLQISQQYLYRVSEICKNGAPPIAPFQYNELIMLYAQMEISHSIVISAISFSQMLRKVAETVTEIQGLKTDIDCTLSDMQNTMQINYIVTSLSIQRVDRMASTIDERVKKNEKRLKWTLRITGATGIIALGILVVTLFR